MIELRQLEHFVATVEAGGIRQASRRIHLSPSAISKSIQALEEHLGLDLLVREGKKVRPTACGSTLLQDAQALFSGVESLEKRLRQLAGIETGTLRVGLAPSVAPLAAERLLPKLVAQHPDVSLEVQVSQADRLRDRLVRGELDLAVGLATAFAAHGGLEVETLYRETLQWWSRAGHPLDGADCSTLAAIASYPLVTQVVPAAYQGWMDELALRVRRESSNGALRHALRSIDYQALIRIVTTTDAITILPSRIARLFAGRPISPLPVRFVPPPFEIAAAWLRLAPPTPLAERFLDLLKQAVA